MSLWERIRKLLGQGIFRFAECAHENRQLNFSLRICNSFEKKHAGIKKKDYAVFFPHQLGETASGP